MTEPASFAEQMALWAVFYATVAGVTGGLIGLLFVALGLNPQIMALGAPSGLRVLAAQTFHTFLVMLIIALMALIPDTSARAMLITLAVVGIQGVLRLVLDLRQARRDPDPHWSAVQSLARYISPAIAYLLALQIAIDLRDGASEALGGIAIILGLLLLSAAANCWDLLAEIGNLDRTR